MLDDDDGMLPTNKGTVDSELKLFPRGYELLNFGMLDLSMYDDGYGFAEYSPQDEETFT